MLGYAAVKQPAFGAGVLDIVALHDRQPAGIDSFEVGVLDGVAASAIASGGFIRLDGVSMDCDESGTNCAHWISRTVVNSRKVIRCFLVNPDRINTDNAVAAQQSTRRID